MDFVFNTFLWLNVKALPQILEKQTLSILWPYLFFLWGCAIITCGIYNAIQHFRRWRWRRRRMIVMLMNNDKMPIRFYVYTLCHLLFRMVFARLHSHLSRSQPKPIFNALCVPWLNSVVIWNDVIQLWPKQFSGKKRAKRIRLISSCSARIECVLLNTTAGSIIIKLGTMFV